MVAKVKRKVKGWTIKETTLNNKSRKGKYVYIKKENKRASYYKVKEVPLSGNLDYYVALYESNLGKTGKGRFDRADKIRKQMTHQDLIKKARSQNKAMDKLIGKGIWSTQLQDASNKTPLEIKESYKELLFKAILSRDEQTMNLLIQDQNIQKLRERFEYKINVIDPNQNILVHLERVGDKDLQEVVSDMKMSFPKGKHIDYTPSEMKSMGYNQRFMKKGSVSRIDIRIIMRKGI